MHLHSLSKMRATRTRTHLLRHSWMLEASAGMLRIACHHLDAATCRRARDSSNSSAVLTPPGNTATPSRCCVCDPGEADVQRLRLEVRADYRICMPRRLRCARDADVAERRGRPPVPQPQNATPVMFERRAARVAMLRSMSRSEGR